MRNILRMSVLRNKFGSYGYGTYMMIRERITEDGVFDMKGEWDYELYAGEFDIDEGTLRQILEFLVHCKVLSVRKNADGHIIYSPDIEFV